MGLGLAACSPRGEAPEKAPRFDLVAEAPYAVARAEPTLIDLGTPAARDHLGAGWSADEVDRRGETFVWSLGDEHELRFFLLAPRDLELSFAARPFRFDGAPAQGLEVALGERPVARLELPPGRGEHRLLLPASALRAGENVLRLRPAYARAPHEVVPGAGDERRLAIAWDWLRFGAGDGDSGETERAEPRHDAERDLLYLPAGSELSFFLPLPAGAALVAERAEPRGGARLEVLVESDGGGGERELARLEESARLDLPLELVEGGPARLTLRALAGGAGGAAGKAGVALRGPRIAAPPDEAREVADRSPSRGRPTGEPRQDLDRRPDLVVYLIDTLRADHVGVYGYGGGTTPHLDAFAGEAVVFERAVAQSSWTKASVASIFTGLWPRAHAANTRDDRLSGDALTLAELLREAGYETAAFVTNPNVTESFGFHQGFETFRYLGAASSAEATRREVVEWLDDRPESGEQVRPLFLYVHTIDPHSPYVPPAEYHRRFAPEVADPFVTGGKANLDDLQAGRKEVTAAELAELRALYDAEIAQNDQGFGDLMEDLRQRGRFEDSLVVVVSDHGEEFHEHGNFTHGRALHVESLWVPLVVRWPGGEPRGRVAAPAQHVDLLPTLLAAAGVAVPEHVEGRDLLTLADEERRIYSYLHLDGPQRMSASEAEWKLIQRLDGERLIWPRLYQLEEDPGEQENRAGERPVRAGYLAGAMRRKLADEGPGLEAEQAIVDPALRESLKALGYVQ